MPEPVLAPVVDMVEKVAAPVVEAVKEAVAAVVPSVPTPAPAPVVVDVSKVSKINPWLVMAVIAVAAIGGYYLYKKTKPQKVVSK